MYFMNQKGLSSGTLSQFIANCYGLNSFYIWFVNSFRCLDKGTPVLEASRLFLFWSLKQQYRSIHQLGSIMNHLV